MILELKNIRHVYNGKRVLDIPSLSIKRGAIYCLVGPNGSGKTTLLSIMSLILRPTKGEIHLDGSSVLFKDKSLMELRKSMTMVLQNPYLFNMSVAKNVSYGLRARRLSKKACEAKARDALHIVGLDGFEKRSAKELSGGETQLVALARAFVLDPKVLFLDEPTANVDSKNVHRFEEIISRINRELGTTIVMTTHNLSQAYRITENVLSMFDGSFVSSTMHDLFSGKIHITEKGTCFDTGHCSIWIAGEIKNHESTHVSIDPEDIIVSKRPFSSSARNRFKGVVTKVVDQGGRTFLEVRSEEIFKVLITHTSLKEMGINVNSELYLTFKASSVHIL